VPEIAHVYCSFCPPGLPAAGSSGQLRAFSHDGEKPARCRGAESLKNFSKAPGDGSECKSGAAD